MNMLTVFVVLVAFVAIAIGGAIFCGRTYESKDREVNQ